MVNDVAWTQDPNLVLALHPWFMSGHPKWVEKAVLRRIPGRYEAFVAWLQEGVIAKLAELRAASE